MKLQIYKICHSHDQIEQYGLFENDRIKLIDLSSIDNKFNLNYNQLNPYWNEGCGIILPYLNNIKSDLIGFQHYRRWYHSELSNLKVNEIVQGKIQVFQDRGVSHYDQQIKEYEFKALANHMYFWGLLYNGFYNDLIDFLKKEFPHYLKSERIIHNMHGHSLFVCTWERYEELAKLILGYMNFVANRYKFDMADPLEWKRLIDENVIKFNITNNIKMGKPSWGGPKIDYKLYPNVAYRSFGMMIEYFVSMFAHHYGFVFDYNNQIHFVSK